MTHRWPNLGWTATQPKSGNGGMWWAVAWLQERVVQWVQGLVPGEAGRLELEQLELVLIISAMSEQSEAWAEKSNMAKLHKMCTVPQRILCISFFCITDATNLGPLFVCSFCHSLSSSSIRLNGVIHSVTLVATQL